MSNEIRHILLIPAEGDPHGLSKQGPCGASPPIALFAGGVWVDPHDSEALVSNEGAVKDLIGHYRDRTPLPGALVLAWDGKPVAEGCDRAHRCASAAGHKWFTMCPVYRMDSIPSWAQDWAGATESRLVVVSA